MAGHFEVDKTQQQDLCDKLQKFLKKQSIKEMKPFSRYQDGDATFQSLTDRNEQDDEHVISMYPYTFKFDDEDCEFAIAEIHLFKDLTVNKIYMVM